MNYKTFTLSYWPNAKSIKAEQRRDIKVESFQQLQSVFRHVRPIANKIDQTIMTRCWQEDRGKACTSYKAPYLITLDYDSTNEEPLEVLDRLKDLNINHFIFTTWTHKTIETPQKKNNGKNCFKVVLELTADNPDELILLTKSLAHLMKKGFHKTDDTSAGIFFGGCHPDFQDEFRSYVFNDGLSPEQAKLFLLENVPEEAELKKDPLDDFEMWEKTEGQKYTPERIAKALSIIKYEEVGDLSKYDIWVRIGLALHSTGDDFFEMWDEWCLENCAEYGVYNREENEKFWENKVATDNVSELCTLSTLWYLEKLFKDREATSAIRQSAWTFFDSLANEEPEEVKFLIDGLLVENSIGFLVGTGGVGKSSLCLEVAKAISSGENLFGDERYSTQEGTVVILNKEDSLNKVHNQVHNLIDLDLDRKYRAYQDFDEDGPVINAGDRDEAANRWRNVARPQWAQSNIRLTDDKGENLEAIGSIMSSLKSLQEELANTGRPPLKLVIFDPLNMWHGGDQNAQRDMSYIFSAFQQVQRELDTAVLIVHHMNKSSGFSGSHTIRDSGRFMWYLRPLLDGKEETPFIDFYIEKNNDAKANYSALTFTRTDKGLLDLANITDDEVDNEN